ncbi:MAG: hypothetical protein JWM16_5 [Verrucomicrobiales bacterium]|nr:hypothetical protein [Verrucomicrobiales bacterium]
MKRNATTPELAAAEMIIPVGRGSCRALIKPESSFCLHPSYLQPVAAEVMRQTFPSKRMKRGYEFLINTGSTPCLYSSLSANRLDSHQSPIRDQQSRACSCSHALPVAAPSRCQGTDSHSMAKGSPTQWNACSRVITGCHAFARINNLEPKPSIPAPSRDTLGVAAEVVRQTAAHPSNPTIQESTNPTIRSSTQLITSVGQGRSQSEPSPVLFVRRRALIHTLVPRPPRFAPLPFRKLKVVKAYSRLGKVQKMHAGLKVKPRFALTLSLTHVLTLSPLLPLSFGQNPVSHAIAQNAIAKIPIPVFLHLFASPRQGCASLGKATQASIEKTSASLACKASFLCRMETPQPFARKRPASSRFVAHIRALSLIIARCSGIPLGIAPSRELKGVLIVLKQALNSELTQANSGVAQILLSYGAKFLTQSDRFRPNLSQRPFRRSIRPILTYSQIQMPSCTLVDQTITSRFVAKRVSGIVRKYQHVSARAPILMPLPNMPLPQSRPARFFGHWTLVYGLPFAGLDKPSHLPKLPPC